MRGRCCGHAHGSASLTRVAGVLGYCRERPEPRRCSRSGVAQACTSSGSSETESTSFLQSLRPLLDIVKRVPFTVSIVVVIVVLGVVSQAFWRPISESGWWPHIAYGLPALEEGKWWTPISGAFFARIPAQYIPVLGGYILMAGFAEWRLGTRWAVITTWAGQLFGTLGAAALLAIFR